MVTNRFCPGLFSLSVEQPWASNVTIHPASITQSHDKARRRGNIPQPKFQISEHCSGVRRISKLSTVVNHVRPPAARLRAGHSGVGRSAGHDFLTLGATPSEPSSTVTDLGTYRLSIFCSSSSHFLFHVSCGCLLINPTLRYLT